jgi:hypothetical protein
MARRHRHSAVRTAAAAVFLSGVAGDGFATEPAWVELLWLPPPPCSKIGRRPPTTHRGGLVVAAGRHLIR